MSRIVCLHGVPKSIMSDRGTQFTSHFWRQLHESLGTRLEFSTAFHTQTYGQTERTNQILEDMLRECALDYGASWDESLPYAELSYNNSIKPVLRWHRLSFSMGESVLHHCYGMVLEKETFLGQN